MLDDFYKELSECVKHEGIEKVYYSFVDEEIDENKTYITYYRVSKNQDYEIEVDSSVIQVSIFSKSLEVAIMTRDNISKHFSGMNKIIGKTEVCGVDIENEQEDYDHENKLHHAITSIRLLTKRIN